MRKRAIVFFVICCLAGCRPGEDGPIAVSIIGAEAGASQAPISLTGATKAGLVRIDREGQVVPGIAVRWAILDDGVDYIFRIDDEAGLPAKTVARRLRTALRHEADNPDFAPVGAIQRVEAVTATVVEVRLSAPQPDLLLLLARPEFAVGNPASLRRSGGIAGTAPSTAEADGARAVLLRKERVGKAVARFQAGGSALVLGGTFNDLPVARMAQSARATLRFDPASGLFGLAIRNPALDAELRSAVSMTIDRDRIVAAIGAPGQAKATTIAGSTIEPPLSERRAAARALLAGQTARLRIAMPPGPGARLLLALLADDLRAIGVETVPAAAGARADLVLVDRVAPPGTLTTLACALSAGCDPRDRLALINPPFIPIAAPVRWSLVAPELDLFTENALAAHPLDQLRKPR